MCLALLLAAASLAPAQTTDFPYRHGLVCELGSASTEGSCSAPIAGAELRVEDSFGNVVRATTNERGEFQFDAPFVMDGREYSILVRAAGYGGAFRLQGIEHVAPSEPASKIQVVFALPGPVQDLPGDSYLSCPRGVRYLLHSGVRFDNTCSTRRATKYCRSMTDTTAYAEANCDEGCTNTGGPGFCCRMGTPGCELERLLQQTD